MKRTKGLMNLPMTPREIVKLMESAGFVHIGGNGSHRKYYQESTGKTVIVPFHAKDLKKGTEQGILKQAGLK